MKMPWTDRSGLAKVAVILVAVFLVSLGLCGANLLMVNYGPHPGGSWLLSTGIIELMGMLASLFGLLVVGVIALVRSIGNTYSSKRDHED
jgi:hypothetical protein